MAHREQIFTPKTVIDRIFRELEYCGDNVRKKHIIDNSCGNGNFLKEIVTKYIGICILHNLKKEETVRELETYIHGIEIDGKLYQETLNNLNSIAEEYNLGYVKWDIVNADTMDIEQLYHNKMDYVVGNPPYCNVHDLGDRYDVVKKYEFANGGMTDLYLVFFEIGINMLNENGKLAYITPNSWLNSKAGTNLRNYLKNNKTLLEIYQYGHKKVFENVNTYTCITIISKTPKSNNIFIYGNEYNDKPCFDTLNLDDCFINGNIYLEKREMIDILREIHEITEANKDNKNRIRVKNGFATLNDKFFIIDDYVEKYGSKNKNILPVEKASNNERHFFFYPYDENGKEMNLLDIDDKLVSFMRGKALVMEIDIENPSWYLYGRTQALNDVKYEKIIINNLIKTENDIKIKKLLNDNNGQQGIYSGFYIPLYNTYDKDIEYKIIRYVQSKEFLTYIKAVGKYKNGGYYTFSSKDLEAWLNYCYIKNKTNFNDLNLNWYIF